MACEYPPLTLCLLPSPDFFSLVDNSSHTLERVFNHQHFSPSRGSKCYSFCAYQWSGKPVDAAVKGRLLGIHNDNRLLESL
jgi:hypothetical protein